MKKKKIFIVGTGLGPGGTERAKSVLANSFAKNNYDVTVFTFYKTEVFYHLETNVKVIMPDFDRKKTSQIFYVLRIIFFLRKTIKTVKPDSVLGMNDWINSLLILSSLNLNTKVFVSDRTSPVRDLGFVNKFLKFLLYRFCDGIVAQTSQSKKYLSNYVDNDKILIIPNIVNSINCSDNLIKEKSIVTIGRLSKEKGHQILLRAFAKLSNKDWKLEIVGDGPEYGNLVNLAEEMNIHKNIIFYGYQKNIEKILCKSKIFVLPSFHEGFPNALLEAMSAGLACVSSDCLAGPRDIIQNDFNGLLFEAGNINQLASILTELIDDEKKIEKLSKNALYVNRDYSEESLFMKYEKFLLPNG